jgi:hypothetical protein
MGTDSTQKRGRLRGAGQTGWLGRQDSNLGMAESKSRYFAGEIKAYSEKAQPNTSIRYQ